MRANSQPELRFTETNSADDSAGKTWGLEGNLFWYLAGGAFASVVTLLLLFSVGHWTLIVALGPAVVPIATTLLYILLFRQGRPPGYDTDLLELWLKGPGFGPAAPAPSAFNPPSTSPNV